MVIQNYFNDYRLFSIYFNFKRIPHIKNDGACSKVFHHREAARPEIFIVQIREVSAGFWAIFIDAARVALAKQRAWGTVLEIEIAKLLVLAQVAALKLLWSRPKMSGEPLDVGAIQNDSERFAAGSAVQAVDFAPNSLGFRMDNLVELQV